jgi:hypothetical protein
MAESPSHGEKNILLAGRTTRDNDSTREKLSALHVLGVSIAEPTLLSGISVLSLAFGLGYVGYIATRRFLPRRKTRRIDTDHAWVSDHVARLHPDGSKGYATAQDTVSWPGTLRKHVTMRKITRIEEQYEESAVYRSFRKRPKPSTDTELLLENLDKAGQLDEKQEDEGSDYESAWLPTARSSQNEERLSQLAPEYLRVVELILAELGVLGYGRFAFDRVDEHAHLEPFWTTARREKCLCEFRRRSAPSALVQGISTPDFIVRLFEDLKVAIASNASWLVEIPQLNFDSVTACIVDVDFLPKRGAQRREKGTWKYWQSGMLGTADCGFREAPRLRLMTTRFDSYVRLIFENVTMQDYVFILDRLGMDDSGCDHRERHGNRFIPKGFMESHIKIMKKVMFAASEGLLHAHVLPQVHRDGGLIFAGRIVNNFVSLDQNGETVKLVSMEQEDANDSTNSDTSSINVEAPLSTQDSLMPYSIKPASDASVTSIVAVNGLAGVSRVPRFSRVSGFAVDSRDPRVSRVSVDSVDSVASVTSITSVASPTTSRRRSRQTVAAWARARFRRKARNEAEPSAAIPPDKLAPPSSVAIPIHSSEFRANSRNGMELTFQRTHIMNRQLINWDALEALPTPVLDSGYISHVGSWSAAREFLGMNIPTPT